MDAAMWGYGVEVGTHVVRMMAAGVFDHFPKLRICIGHMGEAVPFWLWRITFMNSRAQNISRGSARWCSDSSARYVPHRPTNLYRHTPPCDGTTRQIMPIFPFCDTHLTLRVTLQPFPVTLRVTLPMLG